MIRTLWMSFKAAAVILTVAGWVATVQGQATPERATTEMRESAAKTAELPDAPGVASQSSEKPADHPSQTEKILNPKLAPHSGMNPVVLLPPEMFRKGPLTPQEKFQVYIHRTYSPAAVVFPLFSAGIRMARPKSGYPREWKDGMGAFGRNYGSTVARRTAQDTAEFLTELSLKEDPRYQLSGSKNVAVRVSHAMVWTFVDRSDSGHRTPAVSTFAGAAAGSFVGMSFLPQGYNDLTHAEQHMVTNLAGRAVVNLIAEYEPEWIPLARRIKLRHILPAWWTPQHRPRPVQTAP